MRQWKKRAAGFCAVLGVTALLLSGCGRVTEEMLAARENGIRLMESGDYEAALKEFETLIGGAGKVSDFEIDILKYRAEAEFRLNDFEAAAYTYEILKQVDKERAEYCYFRSMALSGADDTDGAKKELEAGRKLDPDGEQAGYTGAVMALGKALEESKDTGEAMEQYNGLIVAGKATTELYNRLMMAAMKLENYGDALTLCAEGQKLSDGIALRQLKFNEAVCYEYLGQYENALQLFRAYVEEFGSDEAAEHEIAFLVTR